MLKNYGPFTLPRISETGYKALKDLRAKGKSTLVKRQKTGEDYLIEVTPSLQIVLWRDKDNRKLFETVIVHKSERCFKLRRSNLTEAIKDGASSLLSFFKFVKAVDYTVIHEILY
jgi:hypothetical protein